MADIVALPKSAAVSPRAAPPRRRGWNDRTKRLFLDHLADQGNVRLAAKIAQVSHTSAYRLRLTDPEFARAWAGAMMLARCEAEALVQDRAFEGVEEEVWRDGLPHKRRRHDPRWMALHFARLDRALDPLDAAEMVEAHEEMLDALTPPPADPMGSGANGGVEVMTEEEWLGGSTPCN